MCVCVRGGHSPRTAIVAVLCAVVCPLVTQLVCSRGAAVAAFASLQARFAPLASCHVMGAPHSPTPSHPTSFPYIGKKQKSSMAASCFPPYTWGMFVFGHLAPAACEVCVWPPCSNTPLNIHKQTTHSLEALAQLGFSQASSLNASTHPRRNEPGQSSDRSAFCCACCAVRGLLLFSSWLWDTCLAFCPDRRSLCPTPCLTTCTAPRGGSIASRRCPTTSSSSPSPSSPSWAGGCAWPTGPSRSFSR